jgi:hypothetical protein
MAKRKTTTKSPIKKSARSSSTSRKSRLVEDVSVPEKEFGEEDYDYESPHRHSGRHGTRQSPPYHSHGR